MDKKLTCFVIIGFGKKTSFLNGKARVLDLDQTFTKLIKPVFDSLGIDCYRAIDKNLNGSIDELMLQEIEQADFALVDLSTLNANVMWELGVRHALKTNHTIMICEQEQMANGIPFDVGHFVIQSYVHSESGITPEAVTDFHPKLTRVVKGLMEQSPKKNDSPVFLVLDYEVTKKNSTDTKETNVVASDSFATIFEKAETAKNNNDYNTALFLLSIVKKFASENMTLKDNLPLIICRQALCTYKLREPNEKESYEKANEILSELNPMDSQDPEVLGLSGAINKRLYELTNDSAYLEKAISFYQKGFELKKDYYNGINLAFMLYKKAGVYKKTDPDWADIKLKADFYRTTVLEIALKLEQALDFKESKEAIWVWLTIAEAYNYKGREDKMLEYENKAKEKAEAINNTFAMSSYMEQKEKIRSIFEILKD